MAKIFPYLRTALEENKTSIRTGQKKNLRPADACTKYNGRAPGLHPDYFCHEIVFVIFKDLDNHSAGRHRLDWTNFHTIVGAKLVFCSYPSSIYDKYFPLYCESRKIVISFTLGSSEVVSLLWLMIQILFLRDSKKRE